MPIIYVPAAFFGSLATLAALWPYGRLTAAVCAPLGGSALAAILAVGIFLRKRHAAEARATAAGLASVPRFSATMSEIPDGPSPSLPAREARDAA
jgi:hypothetical protein